MCLCVCVYVYVSNYIFLEVCICMCRRKYSYMHMCVCVCVCVSMKHVFKSVLKNPFLITFSFSTDIIYLATTCRQDFCYFKLSTFSSTYGSINTAVLQVYSSSCFCYDRDRAITFYETNVARWIYMQNVCVLQPPDHCVHRTICFSFQPQFCV